MLDRDVGAFRRLLELLALTAFALAQPVLDVTGRSPEFFVYRQPTIAQMLMLVSLVVLGPPLAMWLVELRLGMINQRAARAAHLTFVAVLLGILAVQVGKQLGLLSGAPLGLVAAVTGTGLAVLLTRVRGLRSVVAYAAPAPLVFALVFGLTSASGALVRPHGWSRTAAAVQASQPPIVFLFLDEFPLRALLDAEGDIDARLFPNFARLAAASSWYPDTTGVTGYTPFAAPAMLSGRWPRDMSAPSYLQHPQNLFTLLGDNYDVRAFETVAQLCPPTLCSDVAPGRPTGLAPLLKDTLGVVRQIVSTTPSTTDETEQFVEAAEGDGEHSASSLSTTYRFAEAAKNQPDRFTEFLVGLEPRPRPTLHFLHLLLPHSPWRYLPSGNTYVPAPVKYVRPDEGEDRAGWTSEVDALSVIAKQRLLLQAVYTDGLIGNLLDRLTTSGLIDDALLVVTADHGTGIAPMTRIRKLHPDNPPDLAWVPLFIKSPGQVAGVVDERNVMQVDLLPSIADVLDVEVPWKVDGVSVFAQPRPGGEKEWSDYPPARLSFNGDDWTASLHRGFAPEIAPDASDPSGLFAVGPYADLVGQQLSSLPVGDDAPGRAHLHKRLELDVDPASGLVPAMLFGQIRPPLEPGMTWLVASVNGVVAGAVAAVSREDEPTLFLGLLDDRRFVAGPTDLRLFRVEDLTLHEVRLKT